MGVTVTPVLDPALITMVNRALTRAGFTVDHSDAVIRIQGAGVGEGDHSVDLTVDLIAIDEVSLVRLSSILRSQPTTFETASLAATRGNGACTIPKFDVVEIPETEEASCFVVRASLVLYADHVSEDEFARMTWLYLKEVDAIDNELIDLVKVSAEEEG